MEISAMEDRKLNKVHPSYLVSLPTHRLFVSLTGPDRQPNQPIVIILPGVGTSITEWAAVQRLLQLFVPTFLYERAGMGQSDESSSSPTAENIALELDELLRVAGVEPPYLIVCHSYGGITAREFLNLRQQRGDIVGMVFVDANQEESPALWPDPVFDALAKNVDIYAALKLDEERRLNGDEWAAMLKENQSEKHQRTVQREMEHYVDSCKQLGKKKQLEHEPPLLDEHPVVVLMGNAVRDHQRIYAAGVRMGNGTDEEREKYQRKISDYAAVDERLQRGTLKLSRNSRFTHAQNSGHSVHITEPGRIVQEVMSILNG